jgi:hypothetical protein
MSATCDVFATDSRRHITDRRLSHAQDPFTASLNALPAVNLTVFAAGIWISAPVAGLRPTRAARAPVENDPKPMS